MDNEEKLDKITELLNSLNIAMNGISKDLDAHIRQTDDRIRRIEESIGEAKDARKVLHQKQDTFESRLSSLERDPVFNEWRSLKGQGMKAIWAFLGLVGTGLFAFIAYLVKGFFTK